MDCGVLLCGSLCDDVFCLGCCVYVKFDVYGLVSVIVSISVIWVDCMIVFVFLVDLFFLLCGNWLFLVFEKFCGIWVCKDERWSVGEYLLNFGFE